MEGSRDQDQHRGSGLGGRYPLTLIEKGRPEQRRTGGDGVLAPSLLPSAVAKLGHAHGVGYLGLAPRGGRLTGGGTPAQNTIKNLNVPGCGPRARGKPIHSGAREVAWG